MDNGGLEERLTTGGETASENTGKKSTLGSKFKNWAASASAGWTFYTPIMIPIEYFFADMEATEVVASRFLAILGHTIGLPPYQKVREFLGRKFNVREESSKLAKRVINAVSFIPTHPPTYALMLLGAGMIAGDGMSLDKMQYALPAGLAVVMGTSPVFSPFMEFWRTRVFKMEPTYKKI